MWRQSRCSIATDYWNGCCDMRSRGRSTLRRRRSATPSLRKSLDSSHRGIIGLQFSSRASLADRESARTRAVGAAMEQISHRRKYGLGAGIGPHATDGDRSGLAPAAHEGHHTFSTLRNNIGPATSSNALDDGCHLSPTAAFSAAAH